MGDDDKTRVHASSKIIKLAFYLFKHDSLNPFTIDSVVTEVGSSTIDDFGIINRELDVIMAWLLFNAS